MAKNPGGQKPGGWSRPPTKGRGPTGFRGPSKISGGSMPPAVGTGKPVGGCAVLVLGALGTLGAAGTEIVRWLS